MNFILVYTDLISKIVYTMPVEAESKSKAEEKFMESNFPLLYNLGYLSLESAFGDLEAVGMSLSIYSTDEEEYICE